MKTVYVVRHSKAEQNFIGIDFERKLTEIGKSNTELVAKRFLDTIKKIDLFISSPAKRAKGTAQLFAEIFKIHKDQIVYKSELYNAPSFIFNDIIVKQDDAIDSIILFAHNPGITEFINSLQLVQLDNMPTTGIFGFTIDTNTWKSFNTAKKVFLLFDYPKLNK